MRSAENQWPQGWKNTPQQRQSEDCRSPHRAVATGQHPRRSGGGHQVPLARCVFSPSPGRSRPNIRNSLLSVQQLIACPVSQMFCIAYNFRGSLLRSTLFENRMTTPATDTPGVSARSRPGPGFAHFLKKQDQTQFNAAKSITSPKKPPLTASSPTASLCLSGMPDCTYAPPPPHSALPRHSRGSACRS